MLLYIARTESGHTLLFRRVTEFFMRGQELLMKTEAGNFHSTGIASLQATPDDNPVGDAMTVLKPDDGGHPDMATAGESWMRLGPETAVPRELVETTFSPMERLARWALPDAFIPDTDDPNHPAWNDPWHSGTHYKPEAVH